MQKDNRRASTRGVVGKSDAGNVNESAIIGDGFWGQDSSPRQETVANPRSSTFLL